MSSFTMKNEALELTIDSMGAELTGVRDADGTEYLWNGNPAFWNRRSPILFPFVGGLRNREYLYQGKKWHMGQHGFARDMEFTLLSNTNDEVWYLLKANDDTLASYPFLFQLEIGYRLEGSTIMVIWRVENTGKADMPFSIGGHPAFNCPITEGTKRTDYEFRFDNQNMMTSMAIDENGLAIPTVITPLPETEGHSLLISDHLFDQDALVIAGGQAHQVSIARKGLAPYVTVTFDAPLCGLWSPKGAHVPFVCIEPWYGRCDASDYSGTLEEREYGQTAKPGETMTYSYAMTFGSNA